MPPPTLQKDKNSPWISANERVSYLSINLSMTVIIICESFTVQPVKVVETRTFLSVDNDSGMMEYHP